jgi:hypothetical protein
LPKLQIPDRYQPGLAKIRDLNQNSIEAIRNRLENVPDTTSPEDLADASASSAVNIPGAAGVVEALVSLYVLKSGNESVTLEQFADDICDAMASLKSDLRLNEEQRISFREKLLTLLSIDRLWLISKAFDLQTDDERTFCDARILTDLRPVFGAQVSEGPRATVIVHLLKLGYHENNKRHQKFYVALDSKDLKELKKVIDRAEEKATALKSKFKELRFLGLS